MTPEISIVTPAHNEEGNLRLLVSELDRVLGAQNESYEVVIVDDGSRDNTWQVLSDLCQEHEEVVGIRLARNFGHQHALVAGLHHARGQAIVSMDADLQHPPSVIPVLLEKWRGGAKIVMTKRLDKEETGWFKRTTSREFYRIFSWLSNIDISAGTSDFRLMDRQALEHLLSFGDAEYFLRGMIQWMGYRDCETVEFQVRARHSGQTSYTLRKMLSFAANAILSFSVRPLYIGIYVGLMTSALSFLELLYVGVQYARGLTVPGWASILGVVSLLFGILFFILGLMGLYLAKMYRMLQSRPRFIVGEHLGGDAT